MKPRAVHTAGICTMPVTCRFCTACFALLVLRCRFCDACFALLVSTVCLVLTVPAMYLLSWLYGGFSVELYEK